MVTDLRKPDDVLRSYLLLLVVVLIVGFWAAQVFYMYDIKNMPAKGLWYALKATPDTPILWVGPIIGLVIGLFIFAIVFKRMKTNFGGARFESKLRGNDMVSQDALIAMTKSGKDQLLFAGIPVPKEVESTQFFVTGSTGTGKSVCISLYIESLIARKDRMVCVDPDGGFMRYFYKEGDIILNPFDVRSEGWSIFNEIRTGYDCEQYAISMIPKSPSTEQESWNSMARTIVSETLAVLVKKGQANTERLLYWITEASNEELHELLEGTTAAGCFHGAEQTMASIRVVLTNYVSPHKFLKEGSFSFRDWLDNGTGNLYITWREDMLQALKPLISCWTDVVCASVLSLGEDRDRRIHLIVDEMDSLEKLNFMVDAATKGRKKGLRIMPGVQSLAQLNNTYGNNDALTLRNSFRSFCSFGIGDLDTYTAEEISKAFGKHTVVRKEKSNTGGLSTSRVSVNKRSFEEAMISPAEIHLLPNLNAYMKFAGDYPISKVKLNYKSRPVVISPMEINDKDHAVEKNTSIFNRE